MRIPPLTPRTPRRIGLLIKPDLGVRREILRGVARYVELELSWELELLWKVTEMRGFRPTSRLHGLIAWPEVERDLKVIRALAVPTVCVGHFPAKGFSRVLYDNRRIGRRVAEYFLERGLKDFAVYAERLFGTYARDRVAGFQNSLPVAGTPCPVFDARAVGQNPGRWDDIMPKVGAWVRALPKPVGILADSDTSGYNLLLACRHFGLRVPDEVAVVSVGADDLVCELAQPRLSSVSLNGFRAGSLACELLRRRMGRRGKAADVWMEEQPLIERGSSNIIAFEDPVVVRVSRFVQNHFHEEIGVPELAKEAGIARRSLEQRFKRCTGKTLLEEIRRIRMERARHLLEQSDLPIAEVAGRSGFGEARRLSEVFAATLGLTPREYRRQTREAAGKSVLRAR